MKKSPISLHQKQGGKQESNNRTRFTAESEHSGKSRGPQKMKLKSQIDNRSSTSAQRISKTYFYGRAIRLNRLFYIINMTMYPNFRFNSVEEKAIKGRRKSPIKIQKEKNRRRSVNERQNF